MHSIRLVKSAKAWKRLPDWFLHWINSHDAFFSNRPYNAGVPRSPFAYEEKVVVERNISYTPHKWQIIISVRQIEIPFSRITPGGNCTYQCMPITFSRRKICFGGSTTAAWPLPTPGARKNCTACNELSLFTDSHPHRYSRTPCSRHPGDRTCNPNTYLWRISTTLLPKLEKNSANRHQTDLKLIVTNTVKKLVKAK